MVTAKPIRVLLVDDQILVRQSLRSLLKSYPNLDIVGEAADGDEAIDQAAKLRPAVIVMDINMYKMDGVTAARLIRAQYPEIAVLGLSADAKHYNIYAMERAGAFEVLKKENAVRDLYGAIQKAVAAVQPVLIMEETPAAQEPSEGQESTEDQSSLQPLPIKEPKM